MVALNEGLHAAFLAGAVCAFGAAIVGGVFLRPKPMRSADPHGAPVEEPALAECA